MPTPHSTKHGKVTKLYTREPRSAVKSTNDFVVLVVVLLLV